MTTAAINILLGADSLAERRSGVGRVTFEVAQAMRGHAEVGELRLVIGGRLAGAAALDLVADGTMPNGAMLSGAMLNGAGPDGMRDGRRGLRSMAARVPALHALRQRAVRLVMDRGAGGLAGNGLPVIYYEPNMIAKPFSGTTVVTVNDMSWHGGHGYHPADRIRWIERNLPATLRQVSRFVAISAFTRDEMARLLGVPASRIDVVPLAPSAVFQPSSRTQAAEALQRYGLRDRGFVLSVSTLEPRKNLDGLLAAWRALPGPVRARTPLVIAGGLGWGTVLADPAADRLRQSGQLRLLGHVPDADLSRLCARCAVFAYVSLYEGFGLPVLEAMGAGAPVVASATTGTGETAGAAALLVDPRDHAGIAAALLRVIEDAPAAGCLRRAGLAQAAAFTWARTADLLLASWRRALLA